MREYIDRERMPVMVPCYSCRAFCKACGKYVPRAGHQCKGVQGK